MIRLLRCCLLPEHEMACTCVFYSLHFHTLSPATWVSFRYYAHRALPLLALDKNKEEKLRTYKKFLVVRHPFERILSAYRDKLEDWEPPDSIFHKMVGKKIQKLR